MAIEISTTHTSTVNDVGDFHQQLTAILPRLRIYALSLTRNRDQADEFVGQRLAGDLVVHRMQLLVQPKVKGTLFRTLLAWPGRLIGGPGPRPVVICHDVLSIEGRPFEAGLSTPVHSPTMSSHYATSPASFGDVAGRPRSYGRSYGAAECASGAVAASSSAI